MGTYFNSFLRCPNFNNENAGLSSRQPPGKTDEFEGSGGVYFMRRRHGYKPCAVFKPLDEEPGMPNNPKGRAQETLRLVVIVLSAPLFFVLLFF